MSRGQGTCSPACPPSPGKRCSSVSSVPPRLCLSPGSQPSPQPLAHTAAALPPAAGQPPGGQEGGGLSPMRDALGAVETVGATVTFAGWWAGGMWLWPDLPEDTLNPQYILLGQSVLRVRQWGGVGPAVGSGHGVGSGHEAGAWGRSVLGSGNGLGIGAGLGRGMGQAVWLD